MIAPPAPDADARGKWAYNHRGLSRCISSLASGSRGLEILGPSAACSDELSRKKIPSCECSAFLPGWGSASTIGEVGEEGGKLHGGDVGSATWGLRGNLSSD